MKPYAYAVVQGEEGRENVSLQFDHPEMCGQQYKQAIPLFTTPQDQADRIAELEEENKRIRDRTWDSDYARQFLKEIAEAKVSRGEE